MRKEMTISEIYLTSDHVSKESWFHFIQTISKYVGHLSSWYLYVDIVHQQIRYYLKTPCDLPVVLNHLDQFSLRRVDDFSPVASVKSHIYLNDASLNILDLLDQEEIKKHHQIHRLEIQMRLVSGNKILSKGFLFFDRRDKIYRQKLLFTVPQTLLSVDFSKSKRYFYRKSPKYLEIEKVLHLLQSDAPHSLLKVDTFPYLQGDYYLNQSAYQFDRHSLVVGATGSGKSKLVSLLIADIASHLEYRLKYKVVVIDPHASLEEDIGGIDQSRIIHFQTLADSIDLFMNTKENIVVASEQLLNLFHSLLIDQYNSRLERVLRHSIHLLLTCEGFTFQNLQKLLTDIEYRNTLIQENQKDLPRRVIDFFLNDFHEIKTQFYTESIAPILSFIDEMELLPVFGSKTTPAETMFDVVQNHFLTIFSLDRVQLGDKMIQTLSGLLMQQMLQFIQTRQEKEHILFVIDEVSVVENPILLRFLSEARKYGLSLILSQQYFNQVSEPLKKAIFSNVVNYYAFRVSKEDATSLVDCIPMKLAQEDTLERKVKLLMGLNDRECIVRVSSGGLLLPAFKARTVDFLPIPTKVSRPVEKTEEQTETGKRSSSNRKFQITNTVTLTEVLLNQSSSRRDMRGEKDD